MGFKCGIVGLPNVGKSTLFNALTKKAAAQVENYPFCTIEPNTGDVAVPDPRLREIGRIAKSARIVPTRLTFVDIAGLVRGAASGEGLGNQFLANIREVDAIAHVVRCFRDDDVSHVAGTIDPMDDINTIDTELMLADLESLERRAANLRKRVQSGDKELNADLAVMEAALAELREGRPARALELDEEDGARLKALNLLTSKPVVFVLNVDEASAATGNELSARVAEEIARLGKPAVVISAAIEAEIAQLNTDEQAEFLASLGIEEPGLDRLIRAGYGLLDLITFFTAGLKEARAWTVRSGSLAPQAAGVIHTDFERGFIRAQTIGYEDYLELGGEVAAREAGRARDEGKAYRVLDGDIILFKFAV